MRKIFAGLILSLVLVGGSARATEPCDGSGNVISVGRSESGVDTIFSAFSTYSANPLYLSPTRDAIWLCFHSNDWNSVAPLNSSLSLNNTSGLPVIISGLNIRGGETLGTQTLLSLSGRNPVTLLHSSLTNCKNCLKIDGTGAHHVASTHIQCTTNRDTSIGVLLLGSNREIGDGLDVSQCQTGIQIGAPGIPGTNGNDITIHDSTLHDNGTAIAVVRGQRNFFQANSIYNNNRNGDSIFAGDEGILIAHGANGGLTAPTIEFATEHNWNGVRGGLRYSVSDFNCTSPPTEWSLPATISFRISDTIGNAEIFFTSDDDTNQDPEVSHWQQGREFFKTATCTTQTQDGSPIANCTFTMDSNRKDRHAVLIFQNSTRGSSTFSIPFTLNDPCGIGVISAAELGAPGATGGPGGAATIEHAAGLSNGSGSAGSGSSGPPPSDKKDDSSNNMTGSVAGAVTSGGFGGSGASAGCGSSLNPNPTLPYGAWHYMVIFSPLTILIGLRFKKKTL